MLRRNCVSAGDTSGSGVTLYSDPKLLQREVVPLLEADAETGFFDGSLCSEPGLLGDGDKTLFEGGLQCLGAEEEAVWGHRAGMATDLAQGEAKTRPWLGTGGG